MKNNLESMPNPASEPKKPDYSEDDIENLVAGFKESRSEEEMKKSAEAIEGMIAETLTGIEENEKKARLEHTGIIYTEAARAAADVLKDQLNMALQMAEQPEAATLLVTPVQERLQKALDPAGGFSKLHEDPKIQQLYKVFTDKIRHEAIGAVIAELKKREEAEKDPKTAARLKLLRYTLIGEDHGGDAE
jgi:hypothetical protein